jgi:hypothetical protein
MQLGLQTIARLGSDGGSKVAANGTPVFFETLTPAGTVG